MQNYADLLFTAAVQAEQDKAGMRDRYKAVYETRHRGPLDEDARAFIETRTSFYMATTSASGWPYVQHRGGPPGFLKVLGPEQIGFADYRGNKQFISKGNLAGDDRVALFLMDYPRRARLKLLGHARMCEASEAPDLAERLATEGCSTAERLCIIDLAAMDWNCPQHIEPRFTEAEIEAMLAPRLQALAAENAALQARLDKLEGGAE